MQNSFFEVIRSVLHASKFTAFHRGVELRLSNGELYTIKIERTFRSPRPRGLQVSKHAYVTEVRAGDFSGTGFGEAETKLLALEKSIAEGVERVLFRLSKAPLGLVSSNGWSAHLNVHLASKSALYELIERDALIVHWLCQRPMVEIDPNSYPQWLAQWSRNELSRAERFRNLRILVSEAGILPSVSTILLDQDGHAVMSHACGANLQSAITRALSETCRIAQIAVEGGYVDSSRGLADHRLASSLERTVPIDHALVYAYHLRYPDWIFGQAKHFSDVKGLWTAKHREFIPNRIEHEFHTIMKNPLTVGYCTSPQLQQLYFGSTKEAESKGLINLRRLKEAGLSGQVYPLPHCVA